jgi:hypothetical protein
MHGFLFACEHYDAETLKEIAQQSESFKRSVNDPAWVREQRDRGIPLGVIAFMRGFAG